MPDQEQDPRGPRRNAGTITAEQLYVEMIELRKEMVAFRVRFDAFLQMLPQIFTGAAQANRLDPNAVMQMINETLGGLMRGPRRRR